MGRKNKWETLVGLELQDPKDITIFSGKDLVWSDVHRKNGIDRVAKIPLHRVPHFIEGEEKDPDAPCTFYRSQNKSPKKRDTAALKYEIYNCSYGPTDKRGDKPAKRRVNSFMKKRGFQCHFIVKVMAKDPEVAILTYNMYEHEDKRGWPCHGKHDASGDPRSMHKPKLSKDIISYVESCFSWDVAIDSVCKMHIKKHVDMDAADRDRDFFLKRKDVVNIYNRLGKGKYQLDKKDSISVNLWHQKHKDDIFFYQKPNGRDVPFIMGIQTKWMLETMVKLSHNSLIAMDSTFSTNKYGYQLYTLVAFDEQQSGVPVAWVVSERNTTQDISIWLDRLMQRCYQARPDWKVNAFMVDDGLAEIAALRRITRCKVLLCVWHVQRAWSKNASWLATTKERASEMLKDLGHIMKHCSNDDVIDAIDAFLNKYADEEKFLDYFRKNWVSGDKLWMWVKGCRDFPHANQETNNAVESYHCFLKTKFLSDRRKKCTRRMDWLLYILLINVEPFYRFKEILKKEGYLNNYKKEKQLESSTDRAKKIPDSDCCPHESISHAYWVRSQTTPDKQYLVTSYRPTFMTCTCPWSIRGNICKHTIKVDWLYCSLDNDVTPSSCNAPPKISIDGPSHDVDVENTIMATNRDVNDVDALQLARQELFGYYQLIQNSPPVTLEKTEELIGLTKRMLNEANNHSVFDYDSTLGLGAYESSLKRKKSFLSPKKKNKVRKQNSGLDIDLNVHASEYEPYQFQYLKKRGRTQSTKTSSKKASSIDLEATSMDHSIEGLAQLQHHDSGITAPSN